MSQADSVDTTTLPRISFASAGATRRPSKQTSTPSAYAISASAWIPVIDHPGRVAAYVQSEKFRKKVRPMAADAIAYAAKVIAWREHFEGFRRRRGEATAHPLYFLHPAT